jgi:hypothetical protein
MREDRVHQLFLGRLEVHGDDEALDQLGHFRADHVRAEQLAGLLVEDRLDQPWSSPSAIALPLAPKGKRPTRMS